MADDFDPDSLMTSSPPADTPMMAIKPSRPAISDSMRGVLDKVIAPGESGGKYNVIYGGREFSDLSQHPDVHVPITSGPNAGLYSTAAGKYQFIRSTWDEAARATGRHDFSPESQDINAAWLAARTYKQATGRDIEADYASGDPKLRDGIKRALSSQWEALGKPGPRVDKLWTLGNNNMRFSDNAMAAYDDQDDTQTVFMHPEHYLSLAPSLDDDEAHSSAGWKSLRASLAKGEPVNNIPHLSLSEDGQVANQDGRSRALMAKMAGLDAIPVAIKNAAELPEHLKSAAGEPMQTAGMVPKAQMGIENSGGSIIGKLLGIGSAQAAEPTAASEQPAAQASVSQQPSGETDPFAHLDTPVAEAAGEADPFAHLDTPVAGTSVASKPPEKTKTWDEQHPWAKYTNMLPEPLATAAGVTGLTLEHVPEMARSFGHGVQQLNQRLDPRAQATSIGELDDPRPISTRGLRGDEEGVLLTAGGIGFAPGSAASAAAAAKAAPSIMEKWLAGVHGEEAIHDKAVRQILDRIGSDQRASGNTLQTMFDTINETPNKPLTVADVGGPALKSLLGRIARSPGDAKSIISTWLNERDLNAGTRVSTDVMGTLGSDSRVFTDEALKAARSVQAKPLFERAFQGGSLAPLKDQFEAANAAAGKAEQDALRELSHAENRITEAARREQQAGDNVYGVNGAREDRRAAEAQRVFAQEQLDKARADKQMVMDRLQQAQEDIATNKPGAVWSPRIQQFLDNPRIQAGIRRGLVIERDEALAANRPMNPSDYAIIGEENGQPVIGKVPTMRLLAVAKEGLDRMLQSSAMRNQFGDLNKEGVAVDKVRREFLRELDRINPEYAAAREQWSGDTQSMMALKAGQNLFKMEPEAIESLLHGSSPDAIRKALEGKVPEEVINQAVERAKKGMTPSDKEFFRLGAANEMRKMIESTGERGDETRRLIATTRSKRQLRAMFDSEEEFDKFFKSLNAEHKMFDTWASVYGNSKSAERLAEDGTVASGVGHALRGAYHAVHGNVIGAVHGLGRAVERLLPNHNPEIAAEQARIFSAPGAETIEQLQNVAPLPGRVAPSPFRLAPGVVRPNPSQGATNGMQQQ